MDGKHIDEEAGEHAGNKSATNCQQALFWRGRAKGN